MAERVDHSWEDSLSVDPANRELDRAEEALYLSAKSGSLFLPKMGPKEWKRFCDAATIEENERKFKVPKSQSQLTASQRKTLKKASTSIKSPGVRRVIEKREELIKRLRPQCVDANDEDFEAALLEELGMTEDEFKTAAGRTGKMPEKEWQALQKLNEVKEEDLDV